MIVVMLFRVCLSIIILTASWLKVCSQTITLREAIDKTLTHNLQIKKYLNSSELSKKDFEQSQRNRWPSLSASLSQNAGFGLTQNQATFELLNTQNYNTGVNVGLSINLFSGGLLTQQIKQNKILFDINAKNVDKLKNDLKLQVLTTYLEILINKELLEATQSQLVLDQNFLSQQKELLEAGTKTKADVAQALSQLSITEMNQTNIINNLSNSKLILAQLMELSLDSSDFEVELPLINNQNTYINSYEKEEILSKITKKYPDIQLSALQIESAERAVSIAKTNLFPKISLGAGLNTFSSFVSGFTMRPLNDQFRNNFGQNIYLSISFPVFSAFQNRTNIQKAKINVLNAQIDYQIQLRNLEKIISQILLDIQAATDRYAATQKTLDAQNQNFYAVSERYKLGLVNSLDYNTALTNRNKAENENIQAKYNLIFKRLIIDYYLGEI